MLEVGNKFIIQGTAQKTMTHQKTQELGTSMQDNDVYHTPGREYHIENKSENAG